MASYPFNACSQLLPTFTSVKRADAFLTLSCSAGGPGSGKGTQSTKMASHFGFVCISVGEILRNQLIHHATSDRKWELIAKIIANGELAPPVSHGQSLLSPLHPEGPGDAWTFLASEGQGHTDSGMPRGSSHPSVGWQDSLETWITTVLPSGARLSHWQIGSPDLVVFLACSNQRLRQRLEKRAQEQGRLDDNAHAIDRRVETFKQNIPLIVKYYQEKSVIFDADREEDDVFGDISSMVQERLFPHGIDRAGESGAP
uniref:Nucleoside-diphosphate kinase n=1 Tax=Chelydra serpentina TaxID=8475 RepID=A0A8C3RVZ6_CHESE